MPKKRKNSRALVEQVVYKYGTMNVREIREILKEKMGCSLTSNTIYVQLHALRDRNTEWINTQAKAGYLQTVRQLLYRKKERLEKLDALFESEYTTPKIKSDIAGRMTETEESIRDLMESLPLLMQFNALVNNNNASQEETIIIRD